MVLILSILGILISSGLFVLIILDMNKEKQDPATKLIDEFSKTITKEEFGSLKNKFLEKGITELFNELDKKEIFKAKKVDSTDSIKELKLQIEDVNQTIANHLVAMNDVKEYDNAIHVHKFVANRLKDLIHKAGLKEYRPEVGEKYDYIFHNKSKEVDGHPMDQIVTVLSPGYRDKNGVVILKASVIVGKGV